MGETSIVIEPIPGNPGYVADITGHLADPENDPRGMGDTRIAAARDLATSLIERKHECSMSAVAALLREDMRDLLTNCLPPDRHAVRATYERAIGLIEDMA